MTMNLKGSLGEKFHGSGIYPEDSVLYKLFMF